MTKAQLDDTKNAIDVIRKLANGGNAAAKKLIGIVDHNKKTAKPGDITPNIIFKPAPEGGKTEGGWDSHNPDNYIVFLPKKWPLMYHKGRRIPATAPGVVAHEIGHIAIAIEGGMSDGMDGENRVIGRFEDPDRERHG